MTEIYQQRKSSGVYIGYDRRANAGDRRRNSNRRRENQTRFVVWTADRNKVASFQREEDAIKFVKGEITFSSLKLQYIVCPKTNQRDTGKMDRHCVRYIEQIQLCQPMNAKFTDRRRETRRKEL